MFKNETCEEDVKVDNMEHVERITQAVERSYSGMLVDYHKRLGVVLCRVIANWVPPEHCEDVLIDIMFYRSVVEAEVEADAHRGRYGKPDISRETKRLNTG